MSEEESTNNNLKRELESTERTLKHAISLLVICAIFAVLGTGLGIYGTVQSERALKILSDNELTADTESEDNEETNISDLVSDDEGEDDNDDSIFEKPASVDDIESIEIAYNDNKDFISVSNSGTVEYYTYDENEEYIGNTVRSDAKGLIKHVFENDLDKLGEEEEPDNVESAWSIYVYTENGYSSAFGTGEAPDWFNQLLDKLDAKNMGYQSRSL